MLNIWIKKRLKKPEGDFENRVFKVVGIVLVISSILFFRMIIKLLPVLALTGVAFIFYKLWKKGY